MLIRNVEIAGQVTDLRIKDGLISEVGNISGATDIDGQGCALIPGLHDQHIHIQATAAAMNSLNCNLNEQDLKMALSEASGTGWIRGVGYHPYKTGEIDRTWLDEHGPDRPIRIQHHGGRLWILNSRAIDEVGDWVPDDGRLVDQDKKLRASLKSQRPDLAPLVDKLLSYGITAITEVTPSNDLADYHYLVENLSPLKVTIMGTRELDGQPQAGALKLHYHDYDLPSLEDLAFEIKGAHEAGRPVASHCVTLAELMLTLSAIEMAGPMKGDRIEHGAVAPDTAIGWMKRLGLKVVTQPHFLTARADKYRAEVDTQDLPHLWQAQAFLNEGIEMAFGSDAPFEGFNPAEIMSAAVHRPSGFGDHAGVSPESALKAYTNNKTIAVGESADMCLLSTRWADIRDNLSDMTVLKTWIKGDVVFSSQQSHQ